jgi:CRP-like cAMP-binding protein
VHAVDGPDLDPVRAMPTPRTLAAITLFRDLPAEAVKRLDARCIWRDAHAKEWIVDYEGEGTDVFFVVAGDVRVLIQAVSGREVILADLKAGRSPTRQWRACRRRSSGTPCTSIGRWRTSC